jgi:DNA-binding Lrp family transcriptional regulator
MPSKPLQIDEIDRQIINRLRENARVAMSDLARGVGVSRTTAQSRVERLERAGVISGYTIKTSDSHERGQIHAYVMLTAAPKKTAAVIAAARAFPAVRRLTSVSGPFDLIARVVTPSVAEMDALIDALGQLDGVERTTSSIIMSVKIDR